MARGEGRVRIREAAVRLFNEEGYDSVSLRQIAAAADTTIGNLTYHFAHKEDLLDAILEDLHRGFSDRLDRSVAGAALVRALLLLVAEGEANHARYPFYFQNLAQLSSSFPAIKQKSDEFAAALLDHYAWALTELKSEGWLEGGTDPQVLAYVLVDMHASWAQASSPCRNQLLPAIGLTYAVASLLRGHVSPELRDQYDTLCDEIVPSNQDGIA